jgi:hypothetical protein
MELQGALQRLRTTLHAVEHTHVATTVPSAAAGSGVDVHSPPSAGAGTASTVPRAASGGTVGVAGGIGANRRGQEAAAPATTSPESGGVGDTRGATALMS